MGKKNMVLRLPPRTLRNLLLVVTTTPLAHALSTGNTQLKLLRRCHARSYARSCDVRAGLFDLFKESEEAKRRKDEAWEAQQEILRRRRDPDLMEVYEQGVKDRRRQEASSDKDLKELQLRSEGGDRLREWQELRDTGKVKRSSSTSPRTPSNFWLVQKYLMF